MSGRRCGGCLVGVDDPMSGCALCLGAKASPPADDALVPPIRVLSTATPSAPTDPSPVTPPPTVVGRAEMQIETIRTEGGDIALVATIAGRSLRLHTREHGKGAYSGGDSAGVYISGPVDPTLALAIRWLVTGQGPT